MNPRPMYILILYSLTDPTKQFRRGWDVPAGCAHMFCAAWHGFLARARNLLTPPLHVGPEFEFAFLSRPSDSCHKMDMQLSSLLRMRKLIRTPSGAAYSGSPVGDAPKDFSLRGSPKTKTATYMFFKECFERRADSVYVTDGNRSSK